MKIIICTIFLYLISHKIFGFEDPIDYKMDRIVQLKQCIKNIDHGIKLIETSSQHYQDIIKSVTRIYLTEEKHILDLIDLFKNVDDKLKLIVPLQVVIYGHGDNDRMEIGHDYQKLDFFGLLRTKQFLDENNYLIDELKQQKLFSLLDDERVITQPFERAGTLHSQIVCQLISLYKRKELVNFYIKKFMDSRNYLLKILEEQSLNLKALNIPKFYYEPKEESIERLLGDAILFLTPTFEIPYLSLKKVIV
jgi:hypothetical protein